jgi:hypothetical protein
MMFYVVIDDPFVKHALGIYGNKLTGKLIVIYEYDPDTGDLVQIGVEDYTPEKATVLKMYGIKDFTPILTRLYQPEKPREIRLFEVDISEIIAHPKMKKILRLLK